MGQFVLGGWTKEQSEALRKHLEDGFSYAQAAVKINDDFGTSYTRNATIGRGHRMGLRSTASSGLRKAGLTADERRKRRNERQTAYNRARPTTRSERQRKEARTIIINRGAATTSPVYRRHIAPIGDLTRGELRAMLALAMQNTADMEITE